MYSVVASLVPRRPSVESEVGRELEAYTLALVRDGRAASARAIRYKVHALDPSSLSFDYKPVQIPALLVLYGNYWAQGKFSCE